jgi:hypothetical protein
MLDRHHVLTEQYIYTLQQIIRYFLVSFDFRESRVVKICPEAPGFGLSKLM